MRFLEKDRGLIGFVALAWVAMLSSPAAAQLRIRAEAFSGEPFGVGRLEVEMPEALLPEPLGAAGLRVEEADGRVFYPAATAPGLPPLVKDVLSQAKRPALRILGDMLDRPGKTTIYFLFRGREPLRLTLVSRRRDAMNVVPMMNPAAHHRLLGEWWRQYTAAPSFWQQRPDYPPMVENYLQSMLAVRLGLPLARKPKAESWQDQLVEELGLAAGTEPVKLAFQRSRFLEPRRAREPAGLPLPPPIVPPEAPTPEPPADVKIEPLAMRVPAECLYVRFGSFPHFLWYQDTMALWGGDFQNLVATRGLDLGMRERFETQLATKMTALSRLMGDVVVADVAIIGTDMFLHEGGAYGLLFQAKNNLLLSNDFQQQRKERLKQGKGITEEKVRIADRDVSFLSTPDGSVRSFYVADGDYHLLTTSRTLVRRFLETGKGEGSLGTSREFRYARARMPLARDDTVFIYLSAEFFRNLVSPQYRIEMYRRLEAVSDIEMVELARLAAAAEKRPNSMFEDLVAGGFLPRDFGPRADGSRTVLGGGAARDSLRGTRGWFVPIPDVEVAAISRFEAEMYGRFAAFYRANWQRIDPIAAGIQRRSLSDSRDRVTIDLRMSPLARQNYDRLVQSVGQPDKQRLAPIAGDAIAFEVILPKQRMFGGLRAIAPGLDVTQAASLPLAGLRNLIVGYLGTTGEMGLLARLSRYVETVPDPAGYSVGRLGLWRRESPQFTVFSFQRDLLESVTSQLRFEPAERAAQFRLRAVDLSDARLTPFLNKLGYTRTRETSLGNLRLLNQVIGQLHVPNQQARSTAEMLLDARLLDPLGGQYVLRKSSDGIESWTSTALENASGTGRGLSEPPPGYQAPPLNWFRGLDLDALLDPEALSAHVQVDMEKPAREKGPTTGKE